MLAWSGREKRPVSWQVCDKLMSLYYACELLQILRFPAYGMLTVLDVKNPEIKCQNNL